MDRPFAGARPLAAVLGLSLVAVVACAVHARLSHRMGPAREIAARYTLSSPALAAPEDLRHPAWGRAEMPVAGQPALIDPRPAALVVHPPKVQVQP